MGHIFNEARINVHDFRFDCPVDFSIISTEGRLLTEITSTTLFTSVLAPFRLSKESRGFYYTDAIFCFPAETGKLLQFVRQLRQADAAACQLQLDFYPRKKPYTADQMLACFYAEKLTSIEISAKLEGRMSAENVRQFFCQEANRYHVTGAREAAKIILRSFLTK